MVFALSCLAFSLSGFAASTKQEVIELKDQVAEMRKELAEIKKLLETGARAAQPSQPAQAAFQEQIVSIGDSPVRGDEKAPVTIIEYSDYQCPFCARHYRDVMPLLLKDYVDTGKLKFIMREFPLTSIHANAMAASNAALCAGDQGKYWEMHNLMFDNQRQLAVEQLKSYAQSLNLNMETFGGCLDDKSKEQQVQSDLASGTKLGMRGTPGFFIGLTDSADPDKVNVSVFIRGAQGIDQFRASINDLLKSAEAD
jgi:protein-disulfide isomerase